MPEPFLLFVLNLLYSTDIYCYLSEVSGNYPNSSLPHFAEPLTISCSLRLLTISLNVPVFLLIVASEGVLISYWYSLFNRFPTGLLDFVNLFFTLQLQ